MRRHIRLITVFALLVLFAVACGDGQSGTAGDDGAASSGDFDPATFDPETYFEDKVIRFVTSSGAGGGTDTKIRTLAIQLARFIPGNPATRVSNVRPHVAGMNFMWNADPDGLTIGVTAAPTLEFEFFDEAEWNSSEFTYIGAMDAVCDNMLLVLGDVGYNSIEDAMGSDGPALVTMTAAPSPADVEPVALSTMLIADYLDLPLEVKRVAESGTSALNLGLERGEINFARYGADWCRIPSSNPGWLEDGFVIPLLDVATSGPGAQMADGVEERGERPPHVSELLTDEQYAEWRGLVAASRAGGNPIFMPPGTPEEIVNVIRDAYNAAVQDEDFVDTMRTAFGGSEIKFLNADEADELFTENLEVMTTYSDRFTEIVEELYSKYVN
jgi:hypothetical protein